MFEVPFRVLSNFELLDIANQAKVSLPFAADFFKHQFFPDPVPEEMMKELAKLHGMSLEEFIPFFEGMQASYQAQEDMLIEKAGVVAQIYSPCPIELEFRLMSQVAFLSLQFER